MTPDEARNLLAGYATGSLNEGERAALFAAALEDQELFEELAGQQVLKEVLDQPGARQRLLAALEPPAQRIGGMMRAWPWAAAAATLAIVIGIVISRRTPPPPQEIAQVIRPTEAPAPPVAPPPAPKPTLRKATPAPTFQPPAELQKAEALADKVEEAKPAPPAPPQEAAQSRDAVARGAGGARGFVAGAPAAAALRSENLAVAGFGFNYAVRPDGFLQIVPLAPGFLSVTSNGDVVYPSRAVTAGTPVRIPIPPAAASLIVGFSAAEGIAGSPARRDETSGTVTDQDPPNGKILIQLFLKPATQ